MDEDSKELVKLAAEGGVEAFFRTVAAPLVEAGAWTADIIRRHRFKSAVKTATLAKRMLDDAGIPPSAVSLKILVPLFENEWLEDGVDAATGDQVHDAMRLRWAALLANAAAGDAGAEVLPSFPQILAELTSEQATMLDRLARSERAEPQLESVLVEAGVADAYTPSAKRTRAIVMLENLERLGLCVVRPPNETLNRVREQIEEAPLVERWTRVWITNLGRAFVDACNPPTAAQIAGHGA